MFDWCNRPRMLFLVGLLFVCSLFILLFGEYVEQNLGTNQLFRRNIETPEAICPKKRDPSAAAGNATQKAELAAEPLLLQNCQKCSEFERNALQTVHCHPSGFFNAYACPTENGTITIYRPCLSNGPAADERTAFYVFSIGAFLNTAAFWQFVRWRKGLVEARAFGYQRLGAGANGGG